jgi:hypothetical protein
MVFKLHNSSFVLFNVHLKKKKKKNICIIDAVVYVCFCALHTRTHDKNNHAKENAGFSQLPPSGLCRTAKVCTRQLSLPEIIGTVACRDAVTGHSRLPKVPMWETCVLH